MIEIPIINKSKYELPDYATVGSSGVDIRADIQDVLAIPPHETRLIPTSFYVAIPDGYELQIRSRSGLALKHGIVVANSPGTVDCVPPGTNIKTPSGDILVEDLFESATPKVIYSFNEVEFGIEEDVVSDMWKVFGKECIEIKTATSTITVPIEKEVFTRRGWVIAKDLMLDDSILEF